jgi:hypothetical protein
VPRATLTRRLHDELARVDRGLRLPVLELALPALRQRPDEHLGYWLELLGKVVALDSERRLFEFVLLHVVTAALRAAPGMRPARAAAPAATQRRAIRTLLANVAAFGHDEAPAAAAAYAAGLAALGWGAEPGDPRFVDAAAARDLDALDAALLALAALGPRTRQRVLAAVLATIRADGRIAPDEIELFRAIAAALDCPLPPGFTIAAAAGTAT